MTTYGDRINEKAEEYKRLYLTLREDPELKDRARSIALHDLAVDKFVAEKTLESVKEFIDKHESHSNGTGP